MWIDLSCCRNGHWSITFYEQGVDYNELYDVWKRSNQKSSCDHHFYMEKKERKFIHINFYNDFVSMKLENQFIHL